LIYFNISRHFHLKIQWKCVLSTVEGSNWNNFKNIATMPKQSDEIFNREMNIHSTRSNEMPFPAVRSSIKFYHRILRPRAIQARKKLQKAEWRKNDHGRKIMETILLRADIWNNATNKSQNKITNRLIAVPYYTLCIRAAVIINKDSRNENCINNGTILV
jgi:hypothetical protein